MPRRSWPWRGARTCASGRRIETGSDDGRVRGDEGAGARGDRGAGGRGAAAARGSTSARSRWSRRATRATATWRPTRRWCWRGRRGMAPRDIAEALAEQARGGAGGGLGRGGGAGLPEPPARSGALVRGGPGGAGGGARLRAVGARGRAAGQRRVRVGEPDRADARRAHARGGVRRRARRAARLRRLGGDAGVLHQRRRGAGRRAGAVGLRALSRGLRAGAGDPRGALSGGLSDPGRRGAARHLRDEPARQAGGGVAGAGAGDRHRGDDGDDPRRPGAARGADGRVLQREVALRHRADRGGAGVAAGEGAALRGGAGAAEGQAARGLGAAGADAVPLDRLRRRHRPAGDEVGRRPGPISRRTSPITTTRWSAGSTS